MSIRHEPDAISPPYANCRHAVEVRGDARMLFISGLNGYRSDRRIPSAGRN